MNDTVLLRVKGPAVNRVNSACVLSDQLMLLIETGRVFTAATTQRSHSLSPRVFLTTIGPVCIEITRSKPLGFRTRAVYTTNYGSALGMEVLNSHLPMGIRWKWEWKQCTM